MKLPPFEIERYFAPYEFSAPFMLSGSDCESMSVADLLALVPDAERRLHEHWLGYTETKGSPSLRRGLAALYESVEPEGILVHNGAGEAIFTLVNALLGPGDHAIVHYPCYQSLFQVAEAAGADVTRWHVRHDDGWRLDPDWLESAIGPRTRLVVVNMPHNPSGYLPGRQTQAALVDVCRRHGVVLLSDEVYRGLEHDPGERLPAACDLYERAVSIGVLSKTYGLPGLRIGWLATRARDLVDAALQIKDYTTLCCSAPSEILAEVALQALGRIEERNRRIVVANLTALREFLSAHDERLDWVEPRAGAIGFPRLRNGDVDGFCAEVLDGAGVLLLPGTVYEPGSDHFRVGFGRRNFREGLERVDAYLRAGD